MSVDPTGTGASNPTPPPSDPWPADGTSWPSTPPPPQPPTFSPPQPPTVSPQQQPYPPASPGPAYPSTTAYPGGVPPVSVPPVSGPPTSLVPVGGGQWQQPGPVVAQIGEISVTSTTVHTPSGDIPLAGSQWHVADYWQAEQKIPTWAIVLAIVGFCILTVLSLLFLLAKETVYRGVVQVTVTNGNRQYVARIPVTTQQQVHTIHQQVNYVRSLAAA